MLKVRLHDGYLRCVNLVKEGNASAHNQVDYDAMHEILESDEFTEESAIESFLRHKLKIGSIIPEGRLLVYNFTQGWEPLCNFVGKAIPDGDIPHLNKDTMFDPFN